MTRSSPLGRRAVTVAGLVGGSLLLTGCTAGHGTGRVTLPGQPQENPDEDLVTRALRAELVLLDRLRRTARRYHGVRGPLGDAAAVHQAHAALLRGAVPGPQPVRTPEPPVPHGVGAALGALVRAERSLQEAHVAAAVRADSGVLARVLAGMAAAAAQQAVVLGDLTGGSSAGAGS